MKTTTVKAEGSILISRIDEESILISCIVDRGYGHTVDSLTGLGSHTLTKLIDQTMTVVQSHGFY